MTTYKIPIEIEVIAGSKEDAEDLVCRILDQAFIYGCGLHECGEEDKFGILVTRVFDYKFLDE